MARADPQAAKIPVKNAAVRLVGVVRNTKTVTVIGLHLRKFLGIVILAQEGSPPWGGGVIGVYVVKVRILGEIP